MIYYICKRILLNRLNKLVPIWFLLFCENYPNLEQNSERKNNKYFPTQSKKDNDNVDDKI
jgi:hypothetical protein